MSAVMLQGVSFGGKNGFILKYFALPSGFIGSLRTSKQPAAKWGILLILKMLLVAQTGLAFSKIACM